MATALSRRFCSHLAGWLTSDRKPALPQKTGAVGCAVVNRSSGGGGPHAERRFALYLSKIAVGNLPSRSSSWSKRAIGNRGYVGTTIRLNLLQSCSSLDSRGLSLNHYRR